MIRREQDTEQDIKVINALKGLVIDGVHKAKSGHPGGAMSSMDLAYILFSEFLNFDPDSPKWLGRDRFILSAGHESMLLYALLQGVGYLSIDELKKFRQLHSLTPGHPENTLTPGVECTTGPLGQGCAMSVGFAIAQAHLQAKLEAKLFAHRTWVLLGDGCMQECVTLGAASLAGHLGLSHLVWIYDKNRQQISGAIERATSDDEEKIFQGFGWEVIKIDGHNHQEIRSAFAQAKQQHTRPTLIIANTIMAKGAASMEGDHNTHGAPLPADERQKTKEKLGLSSEEFAWSKDVSQHFQRGFSRLREQVTVWEQDLQKCLQDKNFAELYRAHFELAPDFYAQLPAMAWNLEKPIATRDAFGKIIATWSEALPNLIGGSADLEPSNMTGEFAKKVQDFSIAYPKGRNLAFGVREFPMSAIANGIALHGGLIPFDATFLAFADYSRPALRLGAIQKIRVIHEFTHDSFYLGEDGPTHQPIEQIMTLRAIPDLYLMRPADPMECEVLMREALRLSAPSCICLTRQKVPYISASPERLALAARGAWVVKDLAVEAKKDCDLVIFATGSELSLAIEVALELEKQKLKQINYVKVVSLPCWELFLEQDLSYRHEVLSPNCSRRVSIEAGLTLGWQKFIGSEGLAIGIDHYGASAPAEELAKEFGFTKEAVVQRIAQFFS